MFRQSLKRCYIEIFYGKELSLEIETEITDFDS